MIKIWALLLLYSYAAISEIIDVKSFIVLAEKNDPNFELIQSNKEKLKYLMDLGLPTQALLLSARSEYGFSSDSDSNTKSLTAGIQKNLIETGTTLRVERSESQRPDRDEEVIQFRLEQALYNNLFGRDVRYKKELLDLEIKKIKLEILELYENYILDISTLYFDFAEAYHNYDLANKVYGETLKLLNDVKARLNKNIATSTDLSRAQLQVLLANEEKMTRDSFLKSKITALTKITGKDFSNISPKLELEEKGLLDFDEKEISDLRLYKIAAYTAEMAQGNAALVNRSGAPSVNLVAGYNLDKSIRFGTQVDREEKVVGLEVQIPIGDSLLNASVSAANLAKKQEQLQLKNTKLDLAKSLADFSEQLKNSTELLSLSKRKVNLAEKILKEDQKRYTYGKLDLENLIQLRKDYSAYRYQYFTQLVQYNLLRLRWKNFTDTLIK